MYAPNMTTYTQTAWATPGTSRQKPELPNATEPPSGCWHEGAPMGPLE